MSGFSYQRRGKQIAATLTGFEADLLRSLAAQLIELLHDESALPQQAVDPLEALLDFSGPTTEPEDPVLARLFPNAYHDDEEAAGEFRRFTEGTLREAKTAGASAIVDALEEAGLPPELRDDRLMIDIELDRAGAEIWMRSLTDLRLALATRLGIEEDDDDRWDQLDDEDPQGQVYGIYQWLGYLQETLVESLIKAS